MTSIQNDGHRYGRFVFSIGNVTLQFGLDSDYAIDP